MRVLVVGAGVFGAWSAWHLAAAGHQVTLIDAYGPANSRASSSDHSRITRCGYGRDEVYSRWAAESRHDWAWLSATTGQHVLTTTGALFMGESGSEYIRDTHATLSRLAIAVEWLEPATIASRFPQIAIDGLGPAVFEPEAGVLRARAAVQALVEHGVASGHFSYRVARVAPMDERLSEPQVRSGDNALLEADAFVFAAGPWLSHVFPQAVGGRIRATRQEVLYFGVPSGSTTFSHPNLPAWVDFAAGVYGVPDLDGRGFKVGIDRHGPTLDPDTADRIVTADRVAAARDWMAHRFPGMTGAPLVESRVCQYENTATGDFTLDRHPAWATVWIVGGGSGHGFKHGPAVGRQVAALVTGTASVHPRFALAPNTREARRAVF